MLIKQTKYKIMKQTKIEYSKKIKKVKPKEIIGLIKTLPDADEHIFIHNNKYYVTDEWLVGTFAGSAFEGDTLEKAAKALIEYLYKHIEHDSIIGDNIRKSGFPDLKKVRRYCALSKK